MTTIKFKELKNMKNDGLVFYGLSDDLEKLKIAINESINESGAGTGNFEDKFKNIYELHPNDGRRDIVMEFTDTPQITMGKLAIWKIKLGFASWISDYVVNHKSDFKNII